ncbi:MAB_1171c family putative transporter [Micromonospora sp. NPDC049559]|uniref:MAB_1171c family putative transporter n=1 Tax=Micromonospora sp. NPDC049559 TaxID=3155923 RepID=UPI0034225A90
METALYAFCAAAGWVACGYKLRDLRRDRGNRVLRALVYSFGWFAFGVTFAVPAVGAGVDDLTGLPNLGKVLAHAGVMGIAAQAEVLLFFLALAPDQAAPRARRRVLAASVGFGVLVALWLSTLPLDPPVRLTVEYARHPAVAAYLIVYLLIFIGYTADVARLCWRFARVSPRPWLRRGLRVTALGATFALCYCASKAGYLVAYRFGHAPGGEARVAAVLVTVASLLMIVGLTLPTWGPALETTLTWVERQRAWYRLRPLWRDVTAAQPHLVLDEQAHRPTVALRDVDYALHRRITEIRDGRLALRPYIDRRVSAAATELAAAGVPDGPARAAVVEAAMLAAGIRGARAGTTAEEPDYRNPYDPDGGYRGEIAWLTRVATAYRRSPLVVRALDRARAGGPPPNEPAVETGGRQ